MSGDEIERDTPAAAALRRLGKSRITALLDTCGGDFSSEHARRELATILGGAAPRTEDAWQRLTAGPLPITAALRLCEWNAAAGTAAPWRVHHA